MADQLFERVGDWNAAAAILEDLGPAAATAYRKAVLQEAHDLRKAVVEGFSAGGPVGTKWTALKRLTLAIRLERGGTGSSGTKILHVTGQLMKAFAVIPQGDGTVIVGVAKSARRKDGKSLVRVALVHEFGATYTMKQTAKQRRFLFAVMKKHGIEPRGGGGTRGPTERDGTRVITVRIPARPMLGPVFEEYASNPDAIADRIFARMAKLLGGRIGPA